MSGKKMVALFLVLLLAMGTLLGCSPVEKGYYELLKEVSKLNAFQFSGSIELSLDQIPEDIFEGESSITEDVVKNMCSSYRIDYEGKTDFNQGVVQYDLAVVNKTTGVKDNFTSIIIKGNTIYIKADDIISFVKRFSSAEESQELDRVFGGVEYVSISALDFQEGMPPGGFFAIKNNLLKDAKDQRRLIFKLYDALIYQVYDKYQGSQITKDGNKYVMTLKMAELSDIAKPVAVYTIKNIYKLGEALRSYLNNLSDSEAAMLGLTPETKKSALEGIDEMVDDVYQNREEYLSEVDDVFSSSKDEMVEIFGDSKIVSSLEKKDSSTYDSNTQVYLDINDGQPTKSLKTTLSIQQAIKTGGVIQVAAPTKVISYQALEKKMLLQLSINIDYDTYTLDRTFGDSHGYMELQVIEGLSYLPLRQTADLLNMDVGWDNDMRRSYIVHNGKHVYVTGVLVDGKTYVKAREFEGFGYSVSWDEAARTVTIEKR